MVETHREKRLIGYARPGGVCHAHTNEENSYGGADHLNTTTAERGELIHRIKEIFGDKLTQHDQNYIVSAASVLQFYLEKKGYKGSDQPWD